MAAAVEKVLLHDRKPEKWMIQRRKFGAVFTCVRYNVVTKRAVTNSQELVANTISACSQECFFINSNCQRRAKRAHKF
eukprot:1060421-Rhodomonas_salina.2